MKRKKLQEGKYLARERIFNLIHHHTLTHREQDGIPRPERKGGTDVRVWRIAWLLISASCVSSRVPISRVSIGRPRGIWVRPSWFLERTVSFWYRAACAERQRAREERQRIGKAAAKPRAREALIYDHWTTDTTLRHPPSRRRISLPPHPWLPIIERYCVTLPKHFHGRDTCIWKITWRDSHSCVHTCARVSVLANRMGNAILVAAHAPSNEQRLQTAKR